MTISVLTPPPADRSARPTEVRPDLIDLLPDPVWVFDRRDRVTGWNRAASRLYRLPADAAVGQPVSLFVPNEGLSGFARACGAVRENGSWGGDLLTRTATGEPRVVDARWAAVGPPSDPAASVLAVHTDVTELRRRLANAARAARWSAVRTLAAAVADQPVAEAEKWPAWVRPFGHGSDPVAASPELHGAGHGVLVASASSVERELTRALLDAAGYTAVTAADPTEAALVVAAAEPRAAVLGFGPENDAIAEELRRFRTNLRVVPLEGGPAALLEAVAEAVAASNTRLP